MTLKHFTLSQIVENREALHQVGDWLRPEDFRNSHFGYGVPERILPILSKPLNHQPTYTDLIVAVAKTLDRPLRYLEIGVSVGKNIFVLSKVLQNAEIFGLDWERINPSLERLFQPAGSHYSLGSNRIHYICGDEFKDETWMPLKGHSFDIIFSDASHEGPALLKEYEMIKSLNLLNPQGFMMLWDDLHLNPQMPMTAAFKTIARDLQSTYGKDKLYTALLPLNGWLGQHEPAHIIGISTTFPWFNRESLRTALQGLSEPLQEVQLT